MAIESARCDWSTLPARLEDHRPGGVKAVDEHRFGRLLQLLSQRLISQRDCPGDIPRPFETRETTRRRRNGQQSALDRLHWRDRTKCTRLPFTDTKHV